MKQITIKAISPDNAQVFPFLFASQQMRLMQEGEVLAAFEGEQICGAIGTVQRDNVMEILSLYVGEEFRRKGIGSMLLKEASEQAAMRGNVKMSLSYSCTEEQNQGIMTFLIKNGFPAPIRGEILYTVSIDNIEKSIFASQKLVWEKIDAHIYQVSELPFSVWETKKIPDYMLPEHAPGSLIKELCMAYVEGGEIRACIIMSDTGNGNLHLHSAFLENKNWGIYLIGLLQKANSIIKKEYPQFQRMTVTGASEEGRNLIEHLLRGAEMAVNITYTTESPLNRREIFRPVEFYGVLTRFNVLAEELAKREIASRLNIVDGGMPYMELAVPEIKTPLRVFYEVLGGDAYTGFKLKVFCDLPAEMKDKIDEDAEWDVMDDIEILESEEGDLILFGSYEETPAYYVEESIEQFLMPFSCCVKKIMESLKYH